MYSVKYCIKEGIIISIKTCTSYVLAMYGYRSTSKRVTKGHGPRWLTIDEILESPDACVHSWILLQWRWHKPLSMNNQSHILLQDENRRHRPKSGIKCWWRIVANMLMAAALNLTKILIAMVPIDFNRERKVDKKVFQSISVKVAFFADVMQLHTAIADVNLFVQLTEKMN